tara:strand:- start:17020 stop:17517 length:498 start_codon:yes stop_codon:yes gene_type:complete
MSYLITSGKIKKYIHNVDTSFTKQQLGTSIVGYNGTIVTYTPPANAQNIVYECSLQFSWNPDTANSYACTRLQYSDDYAGESNSANWTWNTISNTKVMDGTSSTVNDYDWFIATYNFLIPTWSGERKLRLAGRAYNSSYECTLGRAYGNSEDTASCPHVLVYAIF